MKYWEKFDLPPLRRRDLYCKRRGRNDRDGDAHTEYEPPSNEHPAIDGAREKDRCAQDDGVPREHRRAPTEPVREDACPERPGELSDLVDGEDYAGCYV